MLSDYEIRAAALERRAETRELAGRLERGLKALGVQPPIPEPTTYAELTYLVHHVEGMLAYRDGPCPAPPREG